LLKSLTVIDRSSGKTLSISIPLDPKAWQDAALSMLTPGRGRLYEVLDALRGSDVSVDTDAGRVSGRIVMVERIAPQFTKKPDGTELPEDHKLTLLNGDTFEIVLLSKVNAVTFSEGDLVMQLDRHLDATAGEGMFQQVEVVVHFTDRISHELAVSYVADAPLWKPTYRLVLAEDGSGKALLQAWAVVSNISGENWQSVQLSLTSGAPLAFRYDLHTPQELERPDLTQSGVDKRAQVAFGESSFVPPPPAAAPAAAPALREDVEADAPELESLQMAPSASGAGGASRDMMKKDRAPRPMKSAAAQAPAIDMLALAAQQAPKATARQVAGLTRFDIAERVSLPDGSASMVELVNQLVPGEQTFLYKPGGSGQGYEYNPYRVVRFKNATDFVLEPGPISIYAGGSFVGEGLSEAIASQDQATIPFAAEPSIIVHESVESSGDSLKITRIVRGVIEVESFQRVTTTWTVQAKPSPSGLRVLVRQPRAAAAYTLVDPPQGTETLPDGYFIPVLVGANQSKASLSVVEQTPSKLSLDIWNDKAPELLRQLLAAPALDAKARAALEPIVAARQDIGRIDTELEGLSAQQDQLDERANQERENLLAIQKDPKAAALRKRLGQRLEELTQKAAELGRKIVELNSQRMERKIDLEDKMRDLDLTTAL
jgi:outer membrane murein-binding lipoprotein Lpp